MNARVIQGIDYYAIERGNFGIFQRRHPFTAAENPLSAKEELICDLCETVLTTRREAMEECARAAIDYGRSVMAARVFSEQIAKAICALIEEK